MTYHYQSLFFTSKVMAFLVIVLQTHVTTRTLSAFPGDRLSSVLLNSSAKKYLDFHFHKGVIPWMVSPGVPPPSDATAVNSLIHNWSL